MLNRITIPEPCSQSWDKMATKEGGRFCSSCEKTVLDLTHLSDDELLAILKEKGHGVCGRFREDQIVSKPRVMRLIPFKFGLKAASVAAILFARIFFPSSAKAQDGKVDNTDGQDQDKIKNVRTDSVIYHVTGNITSNISMGALSGARVYVKVGKELVEFGTTDKNGHFELNVPAKDKNQKLEIVIRRYDYEEIRIKKYLPDGKEMQLEMKRDKNYHERILMGCPSF